MRGMRLIVAAAVVVAVPLALLSCAEQPAGPAANLDPNASFKTFEGRFVDEMLALDTDSAIQVGDYRHAGELIVPDERSRQRYLAFLDRTMTGLAGWEPSTLDPLLRADYHQIRNFVEAARWQIQVLRQWTWDPSGYNVATPFALLLTTDYAPEDERLRTVLARLANVPAYYGAAKANLVRPSREHTQLAIQQNKGALEVFNDELLHKVEGSGLAAGDKSMFAERVKAARAAIDEYVKALTELEPSLTPDYARSFRLGRELYEPKFAYNIQSSFSIEQLYERALAAKERLQQDMEIHARKLWPKYFGKKKRMPKERGALIAQVVAKVSEHHSKPENLLRDVKALLPKLEAFVRGHDLMEQDPAKPLIVRETPAYNPIRGVAIASIDAPGPFNPGAPTYFNVQPMSDFTPERQESFLREYNDWMLQILNIHEAIPGHYTQLLHSNKAPSIVKSLLSSGPMVEGWAVYVQRMMLEEGWGNNEPELWLMLDKFDLRTVCNTILDYSVHVLGMSEEDALKLLMQDAYQTETEARGKWRRVQLSSVQLTSYFAGYEEIYEFREQQKKALGGKFNLRDFHNQFLSYGSVPVKVIKDLMVGPQTAVALTE
jgi:hypothetical protein